MSRFRNEQTGVVVSVSDDKDARFGDGWVPADKSAPAPKAAKKAASEKSSK